MAKDHTVIELAGAACCESGAGSGRAQMEAGGCGPCVDVAIEMPATLERGNAHDAGAHRCSSPDAILSPAMAFGHPAMHASPTARGTLPGLRPAATALCPLRC